MKPVSPGQTIEAIARANLAGTHTAIPGRVVKFYPANQTADVEPMVEDFWVDEDGSYHFEEVPIFRIPVIYPRAGGFVMSMPLVPGNFVWIMYSERSIAEWRTNGQKAKPLDKRRHDGYAVCIPGCYPDNADLSSTDDTPRGDHLIIGRDGANEQIRIKSGVFLLGADASDFVALSTKVNTWMNEIKTKFNLHTHPETGVTTSPTTQPIVDQGSTAAGLVKAK